MSDGSVINVMFNESYLLLKYCYGYGRCYLYVNIVVEYNIINK